MITKQAQRKIFTVEYVEVTAENLSEVAEWSGGTLQGEAPELYVKLQDKNAINGHQTKAFPGDLVLKSPTGFKKFSKKAFDKAFEDIDQGETA